MLEKLKMRGESMPDYTIVNGYYVARGALTFQLIKDEKSEGVATIAETEFYEKIMELEKENSKLREIMKRETERTFLWVFVGASATVFITAIIFAF